MKVSHSNTTKPVGVASSISALSVCILVFKLIMCRNTKRHQPDCTFTNAIYFIVSRKFRGFVLSFFSLPFYSHPHFFVLFGLVLVFASVSILDAVFLSWFFRLLGWWMSLLPEFIQVVFGFWAKAWGKEKWEMWMNGVELLFYKNCSSILGLKVHYFLKIYFSAYDGPQNNFRDTKAQDQPLSWWDISTGNRCLALYSR